MAEKDIIINLEVNTGKSTQNVESLSNAEKQLATNTDDATNALFKNSKVVGDLVAKNQALEDEVEALKNQYSKINDELEKFKRKTDDTTKKNKGLKGELRELQKQLQLLAIEGKQNTKEYDNLKKKAGELQDAISDVNDEIKQAGSDTRGLDQTIRVASAAAAAFSIVEGTAALFGKENEELQKSLLKVTAAMSILNGLQEIQAELAKEDTVFTKAGAAAKLIYAAAVGTSTGAMKLFRIALLATGIGIFIVALGLLIANFDKIKEAVSKFLPGLNQLQKGFDDTKVVLRGFADAALVALTKVVKTLFIIPRTLFALFNEGLDGAIRVIKETGSDLTSLFGDVSNAYQQGANAQKQLNTEAAKTRATQEQIKKLTLEIARAEATTGDARKLQLQKARLELSLLEKGTIDYYEKLKEVNQLQKDLNTTNKESAKTQKELADAYAANIAGIKAQSTEFITTVDDFNVTVEESLKAQLDALDKLIVKFPQAGRAIQQAQKEINILLEAFRNPVDAETPVLEIKLEEPDDFKKKIQDLLNVKFKAEQEQAEKDKIAAAERQKQERENAIQSAFFAASQIRDITQKAFAFRQAALDNQLKQGLISEEKYAQETSKIKRKQAISDKAFAIFDATINIANAIIAALKAGPIAGPILAGLIGALGAAQIALIAATPIPKFFKGVIDLKRGANPIGRDTIPAMLNEGESVMTTAETKRYKTVLTHIRNNTFESKYLPHMAYKVLNIPSINTSGLAGIRLASNGNRSDKDIKEELQLIRLYIKESNRHSKRTADNTNELKKPIKRRFNV